MANSLLTFMHYHYAPRPLRVEQGHAEQGGDLMRLIEQLRSHPAGLTFRELRPILGWDTHQCRTVVNRALELRQIYRTGAHACTTYHAVRVAA